MDLAPTIAAAAGATLGPEVSGRDLRPLLAGAPWAPRDLMFSIREGPRLGGRAVYAMRRGPWTVVQHRPGESFELFNLDDDPRQVLDRRSDPDTPRAAMVESLGAFAVLAEAVPYRR